MTGVTEANRPARVTAARAPFDAVLSGTIAAHGLSGHPARVALIGFSQGAIMALDAVIALIGFSQGAIMAPDAVAAGRWPIGALIAFSGRLATDAPLTPAPAPILIAHGRQDTVIPATEAEQAHAALTAAGARPELILETNLGHAPGPQGMARARALLAAWMAPSA